MTVPHQSEAPVRGRTGFSKIGGLLASVPSVSCPNFRAASWRKVVSKLFCPTGTLATLASLFVDDNLYELATTYLVAKEKKNSDEIEKIMTKSELQTIKRKTWTVNSNNEITTCDNKVVLSKSQLHENLLFAHNSFT